VGCGLGCGLGWYWVVGWGSGLGLGLGLWVGVWVEVVGWVVAVGIRKVQQLAKWSNLVQWSLTTSKPTTNAAHRTCCCSGGGAAPGRPTTTCPCSATPSLSRVSGDGRGSSLAAWVGRLSVCVHSCGCGCLDRFPLCGSSTAQRNTPLNP